MNKRKKGRGNVRKAIKLLVSDGWFAECVEKTGRFVKQKDLFGLWDIVGVRPGFFPLFIQVKTNKKPNLEPFVEFLKKFGGIDGQVWVYRDREGFVYYFFSRQKGEFMRVESSRCYHAISD